MKKLLRSAETKAFLTAGGTWTSEVELAAVFLTSEAAMDAMLEHKLRDMEMYYLFYEGVSAYDFAIRLRD